MSELKSAISRYVAAETPQTAPDFEAVRGIARRRALRRTAAVSVGVAATLTAAATLVNAQLDGGGAPLVSTAGRSAAPPASGSAQPTADVTRFPSRYPDVDAQRVLEVGGCVIYNYAPVDSPTDLAERNEIELVVSGRVLGFAEGPPMYHASPTVVMRVDVENVMKGEAPSSGTVYVALLRCNSPEAYSAALPAGTQVGLYLDAGPVEGGNSTVGNKAEGRAAGEPLWGVGPQAFIVADGDDDGVVFPLWREVMPQAKFEDQLPPGDSSQVTSNAAPATVGPQREVTVYFLTSRETGDGTTRWLDRLTAETVTTENTGDPGLDAVRALLTTRPTDPDEGNGYDLLTDDPMPITGVNSVTVGDGVINVDLTKDVWDPYPAVGCISCPSGEIITQQLVWTVQTALESDDPVSVTVNGEPARGIWMEPLNGPVYADPDALERAPAS